jgi:hypothetical protein
MINNNNHNLHTTIPATPSPPPTTITMRTDEKFRRNGNESRAKFHGSKIKHRGQSDLYIKRSFRIL